MFHGIKVYEDSSMTIYVNVVVRVESEVKDQF